MALSGSVSTSTYDGRYLKLAWTATQNISTNKSTISWTLSAAGGNDSYYYDGPITVKIAGTTVYSKEGRTKRYKGTIKTGTTVLSHATDGSKSFSVSVKAAIYTYAVNCTGSKTFTLTSIPRKATISTAPNFDDEDNPKITYSNPAGTAVTTLQACIAYSDGSASYASYRDIGKSSTSYTFNLTDTERTALRKACANSNSLSVRFYIKTVIGGSTYYSYLTKTMTIVNANPTFTSDQLSYKDVSSSIPTITGSPSMIVQNKSSLQATCTAATALKKATISKYEFWLSNNTTNVPSRTSAGSVDFGTINSASNLTLYARATDSRGNYTTISKTVTCYPYFVPSQKSAFEVKRNEDGTQITCQYNIAYAIVNNTNAIKIITKYREIGTDDWSTVTRSDLTAEGGNLTKNVTIYNLNNDLTYEVCAVIQDLYSGEERTSTQTSLGAGRIFNVPLNGRGFALGMVSSDVSGFECAWDATFYRTASGPSGFSTSSDRKVKKNIENLEIDIIDKLQSVQYQLVNPIDDKVHYGFVAQDVIQALSEAGIDPQTCGIVGTVQNGEEQQYVLTYTEFVPLLVNKCQSLQLEVNELRQEMVELKKLIT